jgi:hypothetical protein
MEQPPCSEWYEQHRVEMIARTRRQLCKKEKVMTSEDGTNQVKGTTAEAAPELSVEQKTIAREAKSRGIEVVAEERHLPVKTVRAYVGVYTRSPKPVPAAKEKIEATPVSLLFIEFRLPKCAFCEGDLNPADGMLYLETPSGRLWHCRRCASGIQKLALATGIPCQIPNAGGQNNEPQGA